MRSAVGPQSVNSAVSFLLCADQKLCLQPVDFDGDVNLFHFVLLRCVGKGAFGKVDTTPSCPIFAILILCLGPSGPAQADEGTVRSQVHQQGEVRQNEGSPKCHTGATAARGGASRLDSIPQPDPHTNISSPCALDRPPLYRQSTIRLPRRRELLLRP